MKRQDKTIIQYSENFGLQGPESRNQKTIIKDSRSQFQSNQQELNKIFVKEAELRNVLAEIIVKIKSLTETDVTKCYSLTCAQLVDMLDYFRNKDIVVKKFILEKVQNILNQNQLKAIQQTIHKLKRSSSASINIDISEKKLAKNTISSKLFEIRNKMIEDNSEKNMIKYYSTQKKSEAQKSQEQKAQFKETIKANLKQSFYDTKTQDIKLEELKKRIKSVKQRRKLTISHIQSKFQNKNQPLNLKIKQNSKQVMSQHKKNQIIQFLTEHPVVKSRATKTNSEQTVHLMNRIKLPIQQKSYLHSNEQNENREQMNKFSQSQNSLKKQFNQQYDRLILEKSKMMVIQGRLDELKQISNAFQERKSQQKIKIQSNKAKYLNLKNKNILKSLENGFKKNIFLHIQKQKKQRQQATKIFKIVHSFSVAEIANRKRIRSAKDIENQKYQSLEKNKMGFTKMNRAHTSQSFNLKYPLIFF